MDIKNISIDLIVPNTYNPNIVPEDILAKLRLEIGRNGLTQAIIVRVSGNAYEIIDGQHRWQVCKELGFKEIPCIVQEYSDSEAKVKCLQMNGFRGSATPLKLANLIHDLNREMTLEELARRLPYKEPQMMDSLELLKLPENFDREIREKALKEAEELPSVVSFVLYKNQVQVIEDAIKMAAKELPEGTKNLKALALERVCAEYIALQKVKSKTEAPVGTG